LDDDETTKPAIGTGGASFPLQMSPGTHLMHSSPAIASSRNEPSTHWQADRLAPDNKPRYRRVFSGQAVQLVCPGDSWKYSPMSSQLKQSAPPDFAMK
jgi:hypothetical protein